jgi:hypothetical protein
MFTNTWLGRYERDWFAPDVVAGLTAAAVNRYAEHPAV